MSVKSPAVALGLANARPPGLTMRANAPQLPGGGWAQLELTGALVSRERARAARGERRSREERGRQPDLGLWKESDFRWRWRWRRNLLVFWLFAVICPLKSIVED